MKNHLTWVHRWCSLYIPRSQSPKHSVMPHHWYMIVSTESWWDVPIFVLVKKAKFETWWHAVFSNDKPPQPWPRGCPQVRFRAKLQQIGRTVWCRPFGTVSGSLPPTGRASLTSSLTVLIYTTHIHTHTQNVHMESNSSSSCCTILFISDVHNDHDINSQRIFIIPDVKTPIPNTYYKHL